jgi:hypothetical protein
MYMEVGTMATRTIEPTTALVGYQVREADGRTVVGEVEGVRPSGIRIHKIPGHPRRAGHLPAEALAGVDRATDTVRLREGIRLSEIIDAPDPPPGDPEGWRMSGDWWADLLGHYGLFDAEGRGAEPFLHPDQK